MKISDLKLEHIRATAAFIEAAGIPTRQGIVFDFDAFLCGMVEIDEGVVVYDFKEISNRVESDPGFSLKTDHETQQYNIARMIGHMLHEAGHLAVLPAEIRPFISASVEDDFPDQLLPDGHLLRNKYFRENAASAWSGLAAQALGLPLETVYDIAYESEDEGVYFRNRLIDQTHEGLALLRSVNIEPHSRWSCGLEKIHEMAM